MCMEMTVIHQLLSVVHYLFLAICYMLTWFTHSNRIWLFLESHGVQLLYNTAGNVHAPITNFSLNIWTLNTGCISSMHIQYIREEKEHSLWLDVEQFIPPFKCVQWVDIWKIRIWKGQVFVCLHMISEQLLLLYLTISADNISALLRI